MTKSVVKTSSRHPSSCILNQCSSVTFSNIHTMIATHAVGIYAFWVPPQTGKRRGSGAEAAACRTHLKFFGFPKVELACWRECECCTPSITLTNIVSGFFLSSDMPKSQQGKPPPPITVYPYRTMSKGPILLRYLLPRDGLWISLEEQLLSDARRRSVCWYRNELLCSFCCPQQVF